MRVASSFTHVYGQFMLFQDGDIYYHCFFDTDTFSKYPTTTMVIDRAIIPKEVDLGHSEEWRYMYWPYPEIEWLKIEDCIYMNRYATHKDWQRLMADPMTFLVLAALSDEDEDV